MNQESSEIIQKNPLVSLGRALTEISQMQQLLIKAWPYILACMCLTVLPLTFANGGDRSNVRGMGMARTYTAVARGIDAIGINPASLVFYEKNTTVSFAVAPMGIYFGNNFLDLDTYSTYFTGVDTGGPKRVGKFLTDQDKQDILGRFPSDGPASLYFDYGVRLMAVSWHYPTLGSFAFAVTERISSEADMPKDYIKFVLYGTEPGSEYSFKETQVKAWWLREYSVSYAHLLKGIPILRDLSVGADIKLVHGFGYFGIERFDNHINTGDSTNFYALKASMNMDILRAGADVLNKQSDVGFTLFPNPVGSGFGFDVGIAAKVDQVWTVGLSVTDIGSVSWRSNAIETFIDSTLNITNLTSVEQRDSLQNAMRGRDRKISGFSTPLPTALHFGLAFRFNGASESRFIPGTLILAFDYNQGFNNMPGNTAMPRFSFGAEYKPIAWLPIRTGISFLGTEGVNWAGGIGLSFHNVELDLSTENFGSLLTPNTAKHQSVGFAVKVNI